jgi:hypothetical protein
MPSFVEILRERFAQDLVSALIRFWGAEPDYFEPDAHDLVPIIKTMRIARMGEFQAA